MLLNDGLVLGTIFMLYNILSWHMGVMMLKVGSCGGSQWALRPAYNPIFKIPKRVLSK